MTTYQIWGLRSGRWELIPRKPAADPTSARQAEEEAVAALWGGTYQAARRVPVTGEAA